MTRILIADDSMPVRCGLRTLLGLNSDWQVCGEAVDGADAVEKAHQLTPDLILMDFSMPQMDGVQAARKIAESGTDIPILLFTLNLSPQLMELARNAGLRGAISKAEISKLPYAIKALQRIVTHVGRKSAKLYRTPVNVFRAPEGFLIALTYGRESEWFKNVVAAGECQIETRGIRYQFSSPTIVHDPTQRRFPLPVRIVLRLIGADEFIMLSTSRTQGVAS